MGESRELPELKLAAVTAGLLPKLSDALGAGLTAGALSKLAGENLGLTAGLSSPLSEAFAGGLTEGAFSKLAGENLGLTAGLSSPLSEALAGLTEGAFSKLADDNLGFAAGLTPTLSEASFGLTVGLANPLSEALGRDLTAGLVLGLPESDLGGITGALFPDLPELDSVLTRSLRGPVTYAPVARPVTSRDNSETDASLEYLLGRLNPVFAAQLRGAMLRSEERGPDWLTQAAVSLRRVLLGVLHTAAPNDLVLLWVTKPKTQVDQHGRPTRRAKIDWLCRSIRHEGYRESVRAKIDSALAALDLLNKAIHSNACPELEESFTSVSARLKSAIRHIATLLERRRST